MRRVSFYSKGHGHSEGERRVWGARGKPASVPGALGSEGLGAVDRRHACREGCGYEHGDTDGPGKDHTK